jgi:hypothetical protein
MSGPALLSKSSDGKNAAQRFIVLTSNLICCYKEFGIGPSPTDTIEVKNIVKIQCITGILTLSVTSYQMS